jgi:hypothetical protein
MNNVNFEGKNSVNDNIVLNVFVICQKLRHVQVSFFKFHSRMYSLTFRVIPNAIDFKVMF